MAFEITYAEDVAKDLRDLRAHDRSRILDTIDEQLQFSPTEATRNKKPLVGLIPPWEHVPPTWELRIGEFRVFYDVDADNSIVSVREIRRKLPHQTTEEIL